MDIKLEDLQIFLEINEQGTFSKASQSIGLSQSALSQKVAKLEDSLQTTLFIRNPRSLELTNSGEKLLVYAKDATELQKNFISEFNQYDKKLKGSIRIGSFSSIMRSRVMKKLESFMKENRDVSIEFHSYEMHELENVLKTNKADIIITDYEPNFPRISKSIIGHEEYVIIEANKIKNIPNVFFDHSIKDNATISYFNFLNLEHDYQRKYAGDVYAIIDMVSMGLGRAVMSKHLVESDKRFKIINKSKKYKRPLYLSHLEKNYYTPVHKQVKKLLNSI